MANGGWSDEQDKVLVSISHPPKSINFGLVAPPLLVAGSESIQWEVVWLTRSVRGFLFQ